MINIRWDDDLSRERIQRFLSSFSRENEKATRDALGLAQKDAMQRASDGRALWSGKVNPRSGVQNTGHGVRSLQSMRSESTASGNARAWFGTNVEYMVMWETRGYPARRIQSKRPGGYLRFKGRDGAFIFRKFVDQPGQPARPYIAPAMEANQIRMRGVLVDRFIQAARYVGLGATVR